MSVMGQTAFTIACRREPFEDGVAAAAESLDRPLFSRRDDELLTRVAAYFAARGFELERDTGPTYDSLWITPRGSINPTWIIVRQHDGRYQLQDGLLGIEKQGRSLRTVLLPEWLSSPGP